MELRKWLFKQEATRRELESIIGKLQFAARTVKSGRIFVARLLNWLRQMTTDRTTKIFIHEEARKDLAWWSRFMEQHNGVSIMWMYTVPPEELIFTTDASLKGFGGVCQNEYFRGRFPENIRNKVSITQLEMLTVLVAVRIWKEKFSGTYFWIQVDNQAVVAVLNSGASRDAYLQNTLREIAFIAAQFNFVIKARYISTSENIIPDALSRWSEQKSKRIFREFAQDRSLKRI